jgi:hypothetical protein
MASVTDPDIVAVKAGQLLAADGWCHVPPELDAGAPWRGSSSSRMPPAGGVNGFRQAAIS